MLLTSKLMVAACGGTAAVPPNHPPTPTVQPQASTDPALLQCRLPVAGFVPQAPKGVQDNSRFADSGRHGFEDCGSLAAMSLSKPRYTPVRPGRGRLPEVIAK